MFGAIPLLIVPFVLYNLGLLGIFGSGDDPWANQMLSIRMMSGGVFSMTLGDLIVLIGLLLFFVEIVKSTRTSSASIMDHLLSTFVFVAFLVEFLLLQGAATQIFFILMIITFIDVVGGFAVSIRTAGRDVSIGL